MFINFVQNIICMLYFAKYFNGLKFDVMNYRLIYENDNDVDITQ